MRNKVLCIVLVAVTLLTGCNSAPYSEDQYGYAETLWNIYQATKEDKCEYAVKKYTNIEEASTGLSIGQAGYKAICDDIIKRIDPGCSHCKELKKITATTDEDGDFDIKVSCKCGNKVDKSTYFSYMMRRAEENTPAKVCVFSVDGCSYKLEVVVPKNTESIIINDVEYPVNSDHTFSHKDLEGKIKYTEGYYVDLEVLSGDWFPNANSYKVVLKDGTILKGTMDMESENYTKIQGQRLYFIDKT